MRTRLTFVAGLIAFGCESILPSDELNDGSDADVLITRVDDRGVVETAPSIVGREGGYSVAFAGRYVWVYGDTHFATSDVNGQRLHGSSFSWTTDGNANDAITDFEERVDAAGVPVRFIPLTDDELAFNIEHEISNCQAVPCGARWAMWPGALVYDEPRDRVIAFYRKIGAEPGEFNFESVGSSVAIWELFDAPVTRPVIDETATHPTLMFSADEPWYGAAALRREDVIYIYGIDGDDDNKPCTLARVAADQVTDRTAWRFRTEDGDWVADVEAAHPLFGGNDTMYVGFNRALGVYVAIYSKPLDVDVMIRTAPHPGGPWSREKRLFTARRPLGETPVVTDAMVHPEYNENGGHDIYATYSRTTGGSFTSQVRLVHVRLQPPSD